MLRITILLFTLLITSSMFSQEREVILSGRIVDAENKEAIESVNIAIEGMLKVGTITDDKGVFSIRIEKLPVVLIVSSIGFETQKIEVKTLAEITVTLFKSTTDLPEIIVSATPKVDTVYKEPYNVVDYVFKDDFLILLVYKNVFEKYELVLLDELEEYVAHYPLKEYNPTSLFKACHGDLYVRTTNGVYTINFDDSSIGLGPWVEQKRYEQVIEPCVLAIDDLMFYRRYPIFL